MQELFSCRGHAAAWRLGAASGRSGTMHRSPLARSRGLGLPPRCARVRDGRPRAVGPAVTAADQSGKQPRPLRPVMPVLGRGRWPRSRRWTCRLVHCARRPGGAAGWPVLTGSTGLARGNPPHRCRAVALASWAYQPAQGVLRPARIDSPGPVVGLAERDRIRESGLTPRHGAPGGSNTDLIAYDAVPGNRNWMNQRIKACGKLRGLTVTRSQRADNRRLSHLAGLSGHARPPGMPGENL